VRERWARAAVVAASRVFIREVGTGGSLAGMLGVTVRTVADTAGFAAGVGAFFAGEAAVVAVAARGLLFTNAAVMGVEEKLRCGIRHAKGTALDEDAESIRESPLRTRGAAIARM